MAGRYRWLAVATVKTNVTELPESRVRVEAEVPADEVERRIEQTARTLGRQLKIPGFRKGKVPPPVVVSRVGRETVLDETLRGALGGWYADALDAAGVDPVGDPRLDLGDLPGEGQPLSFSIEVGVRPKARLGEYRGLEVGRREPDVPEEAVGRELEALREAALRGMKAGETRTAEVTFPEEHPSEQLRGRTVSFDVTVKEVKRKELPELDDEFAADAAGFDSLDELRADVREKLEEADRQAIDAEFREAVVDAAAAAAQVEVPPALVDARAHELWEQMIHALGHRGISQEAYLRIAGKSEQELIEEAKPDAERALRREAVLAAVVEAEGIEPSDEDVTAALARSAESEGVTAEQLMQRLRERNRLEPLRRDLAARQAVDLLAEHATAIPVEQAKARDKLWTPEKEAAETGAGAGQPASGKLWTPGS
ncbi:MAG: trigger factor [Actinobacteria bacterium]|nr:MAG: trigger factor [Actinomycetota bacterium]